MSEQWQEIKLGEVIKLEYGKPLADIKRNPLGKYLDYGANGVKARTDEYYFDKKSIIVGRKGSAGEVNLTEDKFWPLDVTYFVKYDDKKYDLKFIYYLLISLNLNKLAKGVKPGINRNEVYALRVKVPSLSEQKRIVSILGKAFAAIDKAKENAEQNLKSAKEFFVSYLYDVFVENKPNWKTVELFKHIKFIDYRGKTPQKTESGLRLITAKNVRMGYLKKTPEEFVEANSYDKWMIRGIPRKGDVLFTTEAPLGNVALLDTDEKVVFAQRIIIMQPDLSVIDGEFLKYLLMSPPIQKIIYEKGTGATATGIKASLLKKIPIHFPSSIQQQRNIANKLKQLEKLLDELKLVFQKKVNCMNELKKSILQKAFSGELTKAEVVL